MRDVVAHLKDPNHTLCPRALSRSEIANTWFQTELPDGWSIEWMLDRCGTNETVCQGRM